MNLALIVLAAGQGTRMKSSLPKVLHQVAGAPLVSHAIRSADGLDPARKIVVVGHGADQVEKALSTDFPDAQVVLQSDRLGTAHAVDQARESLAGFSGDAIVLYGDTPFIKPETIQNMLLAKADGFDVVVLGFDAAIPGKYGRLIVKDGALMRIVEAKDATADELDVTLCNSGVICADSELLFDLIAQVGNDNASGEYYLTDIVEIANNAGKRCVAVTCDEFETLGINSRPELAKAEAIFQTAARHDAMVNGATLQAADSVYFSFDTKLGKDVVVEPNVVFGTGVTVKDNANIRAFSHLEDCVIRKGATVGPYARIRPGSDIGEDAKVGNFVETKKALIAKGAKVNHLSYIGDASVGEGANIGAGTVTCNYDGVMKHQTNIGAGAFIGTNTSLVAPVSVGNGAMTAAGSVITTDIPDDALGVARAPQKISNGFVPRLVKKLKAAKEKRDANKRTEG
ncbi:MAG: bifunctional UDP-N-acetylglucosamine diphosphorylase/glucosamine-1-phosphate N-acetyltransferase GlmU [Paracoccaceae bacterium]|jgi:bifunctional UDP-N-acetylglucosamine pyrophosphorylase / glucosamine-1-phosphate N-acetyltransferase|nr:bifunctional UDP-N-acetylglucosamine diphosphorylase/glucosamine-1-phosphate N-acetyltransferase GlmU [Paracoccaceae bacterium]